MILANRRSKQKQLGHPVTDEVAHEIATMLITNSKDDAVRRLVEVTGLDYKQAYEILTQVNVLRTKDDLLRSVRLS